MQWSMTLLHRAVAPFQVSHRMATALTHHTVVGVGAGREQSVGAAVAYFDGVPGFAQAAGEQVGEAPLVFHHQNPHRPASPRTAAIGVVSTIRPQVHHDSLGSCSSPLSSAQMTSRRAWPVASLITEPPNSPDIPPAPFHP